MNHQEGIIKYTKNGQPYVERPLSRSFSRSHKEPCCCTSLYAIERTYGPGIRLYFSFLKFVILSNAVLAVCGMISWILFLQQKDWPFSMSDFFVYNYLRPESDTYWFWTNVIAFFSWFFVGPVYMMYEKNRRTSPLGTIYIAEMPHSNLIYENIDKENNYFLSATITLFVFALTNAMIYGLIYAQYHVSTLEQNNYYGLTPDVLMSLVVSFAFVIANMIWNRLSFYITRLEYNKTWGRFNISQAAKLIGVKIGTTTVMFILTAVMLGDENGGCLMGATKFLFTVLIDTFLITLLAQIALPFLQKMFYRVLCCRVIQKPEFNLAHQLLGVVFRQFIIYIGMFVFPLMGLLGFISSIIDYHADKTRLLKICQDPHYVQQKPGYTS